MRRLHQPFSASYLLSLLKPGIDRHGPLTAYASLTQQLSAGGVRWLASFSECSQPGKLEERRTARRYRLALPIEIWSDVNEFRPILGRTCDISTHGFYFRTSQRLNAGMGIGFSIMPPWEATHEFIRGRARGVRVEEASQSGADRVGVGVLIGRYKFGHTDSPAG